MFSFDFWEKLKTPKRHFEIDWPLESPKTCQVIPKVGFWKSKNILLNQQLTGKEEILRIQNAWNKESVESEIDEPSKLMKNSIYQNIPFTHFVHCN